MELQEFFDIVTNRLDVIDNLIHSLEDRQNVLERTMIDDILNPAKAAAEEYKYDTGLNEFKGKYPQLDAYTSKFAPMEDEGFDFSKETYDNYNDYISNEENPISEDEYVSQAVENANALLESIKAATADSIATDEEIDNADKVEVTIEKDENGEATVTDVETKEEEPAEEEKSDEDGESKEEEKSDEEKEKEELIRIRDSYKGPLKA